MSLDEKWLENEAIELAAQHCYNVAKRAHFSDFIINMPILKGLVKCAILRGYQRGLDERPWRQEEYEAALRATEVQAQTSTKKKRTTRNTDEGE